jgi:glyoxylase-like metal-dependent hydrolase (beta-lactamase superfamily II)
MNEIFPGIFLITLTLQGFAPNSVNVYLLRDTTGYAIIDTGWDVPASLESLRGQLTEGGIPLSDIKKVILTHCHSDHMGLAGRLKKDNRAAVYLHRLDMELIGIRYTASDDYWAKTELYIQSHGVPLSVLRPPDFKIPNPSPLTPPDFLLEGNEEITIGEFLLRVVNTPGHTPGHISLYEPLKKLLFSGDTLLPTIATNAATHVQYMVNPIQQYLDSLIRLKKLEIDLVLPGHEQVFSGHRQRIEELFEHYRQKSLKIQEVFLQHPSALSAYEIACVLPWITQFRTRSFGQLGDWDKRFAMMQTIALLEQLMFAEKLTKFFEGSSIYYQSKPCP